MDPTFSFKRVDQNTYTILSGIYSNYHVISIVIVASRIASMSNIFLIFPLCLVCVILAASLAREPSSDSRLSVPTLCLTATMSFSFVVSNLCPPVSYVTRIHLLVFQTYIFSIVTLCVNYCLWEIEAGRRELRSNNNHIKSVLNDAHTVSRMIGEPSLQVAVQPEGIYKGHPMPIEVTGKRVRVPRNHDGRRQFAAASSAANGVGRRRDSREDPYSSDSSSTDSFSYSSSSDDEPKSYETGAFPDRDGVFRDVRDLLVAKESRTFKVLRWGAQPVPIFYGLLTVGVHDEQDWKSLVEYTNIRYKYILPTFLAISVGSILGVQNLVGLGSPVDVPIGKQDILY
mmetsp:Transcript_3354/g.9597  ORF Transcript_3354/g.9597 Transcript_3354/m.9597 type:complete len:342 (+) Transcript_3354:306-1331(+)